MLQWCYARTASMEWEQLSFTYLYTLFSSEVLTLRELLLDLYSPPSILPPSSGSQDILGYFDTD